MRDQTIERYLTDLADGANPLSLGRLVAEATTVASAVTPVPGGVGRVTTAVLLSNVVNAAAAYSSGPTMLR